MSAPAGILSIFNRYLERGGEETAVEQIGAALERQPDWFTHQQLLFESAEWKREPAPPAWKQAAWMFRNPQSLSRLRAAHAAARADCWVLHNVFPVGSAAIYAEARRLGVPIVQFIHNFRPFSVNGYLWDGERLAPEGLHGSFWAEIRAGAWQGSRAKTAWFAFVLKMTRWLGWWRSVRAWIAISEFMRERFIEAGVAPETIFTLRHFHRMQALPTSGASPDRYVLFLGRMIAAKGVRVLLDVWAQLEARHGAAIPELRLAGDGPLASWVAAEAHRRPRVRYLGVVSGEEKTAQLAGCEALVAPSIWWEPLGLVAYEAFDFAKPVLAARSGGLTELIVDGETGWLHEPGAVGQLAEQVMALHSQPARAAEMGRRGRVWLEVNAREEDWLVRFREIVGKVAGRSAIEG